MSRWPFLVYAVFLIVTVLARPMPPGLAAVATIPALYLVRRHTVAAVAVILAGAMLLRIDYWGVGNADQLAVTEAAIRAVLDGGNPYGRGYDETLPPGAPFAYGPLALVLHAPGVWAEFVASLIVLLLIARERAWLTLAWLATALVPVALTTTGTNDWVPSALLTAGLLAARTRPGVGAVLVAVAAAVKPYAAAWFVPLLGYAGTAVLVPLVATTAVAWSPLLVWGPGAYLRSVVMSLDLHPDSPHSFNVTILRLLAVPATLLSLRLRSWEGMVTAGTLVFVIVLFLDTWVSIAYFLAVAPVMGIVAEQKAKKMLAERQVSAQRA